MALGNSQSKSIHLRDFAEQFAGGIRGAERGEESDCQRALSLISNPSWIPGLS
jgi:hypothetical protein